MRAIPPSTSTGRLKASPLRNCRPKSPDSTRRAFAPLKMFALRVREN